MRQLALRVVSAGGYTSCTALLLSWIKPRPSRARNLRSLSPEVRIPSASNCAACSSWVSRRTNRPNRHRQKVLTSSSRHAPAAQAEPRQLVNRLWAGEGGGFARDCLEVLAEGPPSSGRAAAEADVAVPRLPRATATRLEGVVCLDVRLAAGELERRALIRDLLLQDLETDRLADSFFAAAARRLGSSSSSATRRLRRR